MRTTAKPLSRLEFDELFQSVCNWGAWGDKDERGHSITSLRNA